MGTRRGWSVPPDVGPWPPTQGAAPDGRGAPQAVPVRFQHNVVLTSTESTCFCQFLWQWPAVAPGRYPNLPKRLRNENLTWESKFSTNVGFDLGFFSNRINLTFDYYNDVTKDLIMEVQLPSNAGYSSQYQNLGQTTNRGVELSLNANLVQTKDFYLDFNFNIAFNKNKVDALYGANGDEMILSGGGTETGSDNYRVFVGQEVGLMYGYVSDGMYSFDDFTFNPTTKKWDIVTTKDENGVPICNDWYTIFIFSRHNIPLFSSRIESEIIKRIHTIRHITVHQTNFLAYKNTIVIATGLCATTRKNHFVTIGTIQCIYLILIESNIKIKVKIEIFRLNEICIQRQLYTAISGLTKILVLATITCIRGQLHFHNQILSNIIIIIKCQIYTITEET